MGAVARSGVVREKFAVRLMPEEEHTSPTLRGGLGRFWGLGGRAVMGWSKRQMDRFPKSWAFWLVIAGLILSGLGIYFGWDWLRSGAAEKEPNSTTIRNAGIVIAGVFALVFALWRGLVAERQAAASQRQAETSQQGLLNERYQKGAEMLGSEVLAVRLGGIYALQRLAEEHPDQYHIRVLRLLCAFVRLPTRDQSLEAGRAAIEPGTLLGIRQDLEAIMQAIGSRSRLQKALEREVEFRLDLKGADLRGAQLLDSDLARAMFHHARLCNVNFANTDLTDSFLSFADLSHAEFHDVNFTRTRLWSADLSGAMLQDAKLPMMNFHNVKLAGTNLLRANLSGANFQDAKAANAWFERAVLSDAGFQGTDLSGARLAWADLSGARFWDADLDRSNFADANLSGAEFSVNGRQGAKGLTQVQLDQARADADNPPKLEGVLDAETGEQLVWRGKPVVACP